MSKTAPTGPRASGVTWGNRGECATKTSGSSYYKRSSGGRVSLWLIEFFFLVSNFRINRPIGLFWQHRPGFEWVSTGYRCVLFRARPLTALRRCGAASLEKTMVHCDRGVALGGDPARSSCATGVPRPGNADEETTRSAHGKSGQDGVRTDRGTADRFRTAGEYPESHAGASPPVLRPNQRQIR